MELTQDQIDAVISRAIDKAFTAFRLECLIDDKQSSPLVKTKKLLSLYPVIRELDYTQAKIKTEQIESALDLLRGDPYIKIIPLHYFYNQSREEIAKQYGVSPATISRNNKRLLVNIKQILFCEE